MMNGKTYRVLMTSSALCCLVGCEKNDPAQESEPYETSVTQQPSRTDDSEATEQELDRNEQAIGTRSGENPGVQELGADEGELEAKGDIQAAPGTKIEGEIRLSQTEQGVKIVIDVKNAPVGQKGIHIHEKGDCSDIRGESMGGHFAPQGDKHGMPDAPQGQIHLGDLGNIEIGADGMGTKEILVEEANLREGDNMSFLGKALVIHEAKDKGASQQPSGASGTPIACAVIEKI